MQILHLKNKGGTNMDQQLIPKEYQPISMGGYLGYQILFSIPVVGFICLIIFAIGAKNVNKKNFARSYFCYTIICLCIFAIVFAVAKVIIIFFLCKKCLKNFYKICHYPCFSTKRMAFFILKILLKR